MKLSIEKKTILGLVSASIVMITINVLSYTSFSTHKETSDWVVHTHKVLHKLETTLSKIKGTETGQQGYVLTGKEQYLEPYYAEVDSIAQDLQKLKRLTVDNSNQQRRLATLEPLVTQRLTIIKQTINLRRHQGFLAAQKLVETDKGKNLMNLIRVIMREMEDEENKLLSKRLKRYQLAAQRQNIFHLLGTGFNFFLFYLIYLAISGEIRERQQAQEALSTANEELEIKVQERTSEVTIVNEQLLISQEDLFRALEAEKDLNLLKSHIISTISHKCLTPLTTILSCTELLQHYSHKWSEERKLHYFGRIQETVEHMTNLVNNVMFIDKAEVNQLEFNPSKLNLKQLCQELVDQINCGVSSDITITFDNQGSGNDAYLDEKLLRQILTNLLSNAVKYSPSGGTVQFKAECVDRIARFRIKDYGIGIPEADLSKIFEFFYRASNVGTRPGTGLGLTIVKKCVDLLGGDISVESVLNQGTTFTITLPCRQTEVNKSDGTKCVLGS